MKRLRLALLIVGLMGCSNNFNHYILPSPPAPVVTVAKHTSVKCSVFVPSEIPETPKLPLKEVMDDPKVTISHIEKIERRYIEELRAHIIDVKRTYRKDYERYLDACLKESVSNLQ